MMPDSQDSERMGVNRVTNYALSKYHVANDFIDMKQTCQHLQFKAWRLLSRWKQARSLPVL